MAPVSKPRDSRKRFFIGLALAIVAILAVATTALAAGVGGHRFAAGTPGTGNGNPNGGMFGPRAVVTAVDTTNNTITLGGVPTQIATVKVDQNIKLAARQPDGTTTTAAIGDFKVGSLVEVGIKGNGRRGPGNANPGNGQPPAPGGSQPSAPANGQGTPNVTVTQLTLVPAGQVRVSGLVLSNSNGTVQIVDGGGLQVTVNVASGAKITKGQNTAATVNDITVGSRISVSGTQNGATVTANTVRIADLSMLGRGGPRPGNAKPGADSPTLPQA